MTDHICCPIKRQPKQSYLESAEAAETSTTTATVDIGHPDYQRENNRFELDLLCLTQHADLAQDLLDAVKAIDISTDQWPDDALQQTTTLDKSQLSALQVTCSHCHLCLATQNRQLHVD